MFKSVVILLLKFFTLSFCFPDYTYPCGTNGICVSDSLCSENKIHSSECGYFESNEVCCPVTSLKTNMNITDRLLPEEECGISSYPKIYGGNITELDEFPWMVLLQYKLNNGGRKFLCGGALISKRYVLTARHCLRRQLVSVRLGEWNTTSNPDCIDSPFGKDCAPEVLDVLIEKQISHQNDDIALLRLSQEVKFNDFIKPICLPTTLEIDEKQKMVVTGWGQTDMKIPSDVKRKVLIPIRPSTECEVAIEKSVHISYILHEGQICAGGQKGRDSCYGDSGGPLMYLKEKWYAVGIVSFGSSKCGEENTPSIYIRVSKYIQWIADNIKA